MTKAIPKQSETSWWKTAMDVTVFLAVIVNVAQWREANKAAQVSREVFEAQFRPYLTAEAVTTAPDSSSDKGVFVGMKIQNTGSIPAENLNYSWRIYKNDVPIPGIKIGQRERRLYPEQIIYLKAKLDDPEQRKDVVSGALVITVYARYSYVWRDKHEDRCAAYQYSPRENGLVDLGEMCDPNTN